MTDTQSTEHQEARNHRDDRPMVRPDRCPRIALLTPYSGHNLGDAAIQDALIANLQRLQPNLQFSGITLNCNNFILRHGPIAFPLCATARPFYSMSSGDVNDGGGIKRRGGVRKAQVVERLRKIPVLWRSLKVLRSGARMLVWPLREAAYCVNSYCFLRSQDIVIVSGGGQLDEEWGGPWGHPFTLTKWGLIAKLAGIPYLVVSVGACAIHSRRSRFLLRMALRFAEYRSYRDPNSKGIADELLGDRSSGEVVPDLAFSVLAPVQSNSAGIRQLAQGRPIAAFSPIAFRKPEVWPGENKALYTRYLEQAAKAVSELLRRGYFVVFVWSDIGDYENVTADLLRRIEEISAGSHAQQIHIPRIRTWQELIAALREVDLVIASRLHSVILSSVVRKPIIAISFDPKVNWVMEDLNQQAYVLQIQDFSAEELIEAVEKVESRREEIEAQIASYQEQIAPVVAGQYRRISELVTIQRSYAT